MPVAINRSCWASLPTAGRFNTPKTMQPGVNERSRSNQATLMSYNRRMSQSVAQRHSHRSNSIALDQSMHKGPKHPSPIYATSGPLYQLGFRPCPCPRPRSFAATPLLSPVVGTGFSSRVHHRNRSSNGSNTKKTRLHRKATITTKKPATASSQ